jgi:hypothetical protein
MIGLSNYLQHLEPARVVVFGVELVEDDSSPYLKGTIRSGVLLGWSIAANYTKSSGHYVAVRSPSWGITLHRHAGSYADCERLITEKDLPALIAEAALLPELARRVAVEESEVAR